MWKGTVTSTCPLLTRTSSRTAACGSSRCSSRSVQTTSGKERAAKGSAEMPACETACRAGGGRAVEVPEQVGAADQGEGAVGEGQRVDARLRDGQPGDAGGRALHAPRREVDGHDPRAGALLQVLREAPVTAAHVEHR